MKRQDNIYVFLSNRIYERVHYRPALSAACDSWSFQRIPRLVVQYYMLEHSLLLDQLLYLYLIRLCPPSTSPPTISIDLVKHCNQAFLYQILKLEIVEYWCTRTLRNPIIEQEHVHQLDPKTIQIETWHCIVISDDWDFRYLNTRRKKTRKHFRKLP